jgi:hypothetical protein
MITDKQKINKWKLRGVNHTDEEFKDILKIYHSTIKCNKCNIILSNENNSKQKCLDHCHKTGKFRQILCKVCNLHFDRKKQIYKRMSDEERKERQKIANKKHDLKRRNNPDRIKYNKEYSKKYNEENKEKKKLESKKYHKYKNSWGGDKRFNNNLLEISLDIF